MLLEGDCSKQSCLETVRGTSTDDTSKSAHRVASRLPVIWQVVEPPLNLEWSIQLPHNTALDGIELERRTIDSRYSEAHYCFFSSIVQMSLCLSPMVM